MRQAVITAYSSGKPVKSGLKFWSACDVNGFMINTRLSTVEHIRPHARVYGPIGGVVMEMLSGQPGEFDYWDKAHRLYVSVHRSSAL